MSCLPSVSYTHLGANADHGLDVVLAGEGIHNAGSQLFHIGAVDALADLLDQHGCLLYTSRCV